MSSKVCFSSLVRYSQIVGLATQLIDLSWILSFKLYIKVSLSLAHKRPNLHANYCNCSQPIIKTLTIHCQSCHRSSLQDPRLRRTTHPLHTINPTLTPANRICPIFKSHDNGSIVAKQLYSDVGATMKPDLKVLNLDTMHDACTWVATWLLGKISSW